MIEQEVYSAGNGAAPASVNDQHLPCVLLLDTSYSMKNENAIGKLNEALIKFKEQCVADEALRRGLDIAVVGFNSDVTIYQEFTPVTNMVTPTLEANGQTSMGLALTTAIDLINKRKALYKSIGIMAYRPWIFMITDGAPNDEYLPVFERAKALQNENKVEIWAVGVPGYDKDLLLSLTHRVIGLSPKLHFAELLEWLSSSLSKRGQSDPKDLVVYDRLPDEAEVVDKHTPPKTW